MSWTESLHVLWIEEIVPADRVFDPLLTDLREAMLRRVAEEVLRGDAEFARTTEGGLQVEVHHKAQGGEVVVHLETSSILHRSRSWIDDGDVTLG